MSSAEANGEARLARRLYVWLRVSFATAACGGVSRVWLCVGGSWVEPYIEEVGLVVE